jgi:hypothetical protein
MAKFNLASYFDAAWSLAFCPVRSCSITTSLCSELTPLLKPLTPYSTGRVFKVHLTPAIHYKSAKPNYRVRHSQRGDMRALSQNLLIRIVIKWLDGRQPTKAQPQKQSHLTQPQCGLLPVNSLRYLD